MWNSGERYPILFLSWVIVIVIWIVWSLTSYTVFILRIQTLYMCEKPLISWLYFKNNKNSNHVVCEKLTCWLYLERLNFRTIWCVKSSWLADFPSTEIFSEPCGVWKATDLLTFLKQTKFQNYVVCEKPLNCWLCLNRLNFRTMWCVKSCW